ncbi:MAG: DsbA family protein [Deltaproteobacteria bacterium]|nr:DsbA family protein [Deltaproteobacteria bacterium]
MPLVSNIGHDTMTDRSPTPSIRFYFSFRSPYAWLAAERLETEIGILGVPIERIPVYPTPELFPNLFVTTPARIAYLVQDIRRLVRERGLTVQFPSAVDPDWSLSHAAFLGAQQQGAGHMFMVEAFRKRFCEGLDLGDDDVIANAAHRAGLDRGTILAAAHSDALRAEASEGFRLGMQRDGIFGAPSFVYAGKLYWGQDRMHFLRDAVVRKSTNLDVT